MRCGTKNTKTSLGATEKFRENSRCAISEGERDSRVARQCTSTSTSETSSDAGPSRHSATRSRIPCFMCLKGSRAASRTNFCTPSTPSISPRESKTSVMPSVYSTMRWQQVNIESSFAIHGIRERAQHHAARFEKARLFARLNDHRRRMAGAGEHHSSRVAFHSRGSHGEKENRTSQIVHHETVQLRQHVAKRDVLAQV